MAHLNGGGPNWPTKARREHRRRRARAARGAMPTGPIEYGVAGAQTEIVRSVLTHRERYGTDGPPPPPPVLENFTRI